MMVMFCLQDNQLPLPTMSSEAERILDMMGLSFSMTNALWIRVVRFWKQLLQHHQQQAQPSPDPIEAVCKRVSCLSRADWAPQPAAPACTGVPALLPQAVCLSVCLPVIR